MTLDDLSTLLAQYAAGEGTLAALQARFAPLFGGDPLRVELSDSAPWDAAPHDARLLWRLVYLFDVQADEGDAARRLASRVVRCLETSDAAETFELLPLLLDQERFLGIAAKYRAAVITRTGFLSVLAESGYPPHVKLWLEHAGPAALEALEGDLAAQRYDRVLAALARRPD